MNTLITLACSTVLAGLACAGMAAASLSSRMGWTAATLLAVGIAGLMYLFD